MTLMTNVAGTKNKGAEGSQQISSVRNRQKPITLRTKLTIIQDSILLTYYNKTKAKNPA